MQTVQQVVKWGLIIAAALVILFVVRVVCAVNQLSGHEAELRKAMEPIVAVDKMMRDWESQGYKVEALRQLDPDPENRNQFMLEYQVTKADGSESYNYLWAFRGPEGTNVNSVDMLSTVARLYEFELVPLSDPAKGVHPQLDYYIKNLTDADFDRFSERDRH